MNFLDGTFPSLVQPVERSLKRQRRSVSFPNVTQLSQSVTLFVAFLRRAYAILAIRTSVIVCSLLEPGDEEQEQTHAAEEWHDPRATTWCSHEDELPTGRILAVCGTRSMDQFRAGRTPSAPLGAGRNVGAGLCHLSVHCELCCDSSDSSSASACRDCFFELCHLQSGAGTAAVPSFSQHGRLHLLAQVARTSCTGGLVLLCKRRIVALLSSNNIPAGGDLFDDLGSVRLYGAGLLPGDVSRWPFRAPLGLAAGRALAGTSYL